MSVYTPDIRRIHSKTKNAILNKQINMENLTSKNSNENMEEGKTTESKATIAIETLKIPFNSYGLFGCTRVYSCSPPSSTAITASSSASSPPSPSSSTSYLGRSTHQRTTTSTSLPASMPTGHHSRNHPMKMTSMNTTTTPTTGVANNDNYISQLTSALASASISSVTNTKGCYCCWSNDESYSSQLSEEVELPTTEMNGGHLTEKNKNMPIRTDSHGLHMSSHRQQPQHETEYGMFYIKEDDDDDYEDEEIQIKEHDLFEMEEEINNDEDKNDKVMDYDHKDQQQTQSNRLYRPPSSYSFGGLNPVDISNPNYSYSQCSSGRSNSIYSTYSAGSYGSSASSAKEEYHSKIKNQLDELSKTGELHEVNVLSPNVSSNSNSDEKLENLQSKEKAKNNRVEELISSLQSYQYGTSPYKISYMENISSNQSNKPLSYRSSISSINSTPNDEFTKDISKNNRNDELVGDMVMMMKIKNEKENNEEMNGKEGSNLNYTNDIYYINNYSSNSNYNYGKYLNDTYYKNDDIIMKGIQEEKQDHQRKYSNYSSHSHLTNYTSTTIINEKEKEKLDDQNENKKYYSDYNSINKDNFYYDFGYDFTTNNDTNINNNNVYDNKSYDMTKSSSSILSKLSRSMSVSNGMDYGHAYSYSYSHLNDMKNAAFTPLDNDDNIKDNLKDEEEEERIKKFSLQNSNSQSNQSIATLINPTVNSRRSSYNESIYDRCNYNNNVNQKEMLSFIQEAATELNSEMDNNKKIKEINSGETEEKVEMKQNSTNNEYNNSNTKEKKNTLSPSPSLYSSSSITQVNNDTSEIYQILLENEVYRQQFELLKSLETKENEKKKYQKKLLKLEDEYINKILSTSTSTTAISSPTPTNSLLQQEIY